MKLVSTGLLFLAMATTMAFFVELKNVEAQPVKATEASTLKHVKLFQ